MRSRIPFALLFVALVGCGSEVLQTTGGVGASATTGSGGGSTGEGGAGGSSGPGGPGGASANCAPLNEDVIGWKLVFHDGSILSPSVPPPMNIGDKLDEIHEGRVVSVSPGHLSIDTCPPNADCAATILDIDVAPKGQAFEIGIPIDAFVHVHLVSQVVGYPSGGPQPYRTLLLQIDNLPTWSGFINPIEGGSDLWFLASDSGLATSEHQIAGLGVQYDKTCEDNSGSGYYQAGTLSFWDLAAPSGKVKLQPGETQLLSLKTPARPLMIRNVDSTIEVIEGAWAPDFLVSRAPLVD